MTICGYNKEYILDLGHTNMEVTINKNGNCYTVVGQINNENVNMDILAKSEKEIDDLADIAITSGESFSTILRLAKVDFIQRKVV